MTPSAKLILSAVFAVTAVAGTAAQTTTYSDIQMLPGWSAKTGPNIGGVAPAQFGFIQGLPGQPTALLMYAGGTANADWLLGITPPLPLPPSFSGNITFGYTVTMGLTDAICMHAWESDTKVVTGGYVYDLSSQNKDGDIQIDNATPAWVDSTINVGPFTPDVTHTVLYTYWIDTAGHTSSVTTYTQDGDSHLVPVALRTVKAATSTWLPGIYPQFQQDLSTGCRVNTIIDHATYTIS